MIYRRKHSTNYTVLPNELLQSSLSFAAKGLLGYLLSKPSKWRIDNNELAAEGRVGRDVLLRLLKELEDEGYLLRRRVSEGRGKIRWIRDIFDERQLRPSKNPTSSKVKSTTNKVQKLPSVPAVPYDPDEPPFDITPRALKSIERQYVDLVKLKGGTERKAYATLGKAKAEFGDEPVLEAARITINKGADEPHTFLYAVLKKWFEKPVDKYAEIQKHIASKHKSSYRSAFAKYVKGKGQDPDAALKAYDHVIGLPEHGPGIANAAVLHTIVSADDGENLVSLYLMVGQNGNAWRVAGRYL